jgi:peptidyl-prolyl cis-trans isomerase A (cyclophilin A)
MSIRHLLAIALLALGTAAVAQNPRVLLDTDRGPLLVELDIVRAPITVANFLAYVDSGGYNSMLVQRVVRNFVVQTGRFKEDGTEIPQRPSIASERTNGLLNTPGTLAMALTTDSRGRPEVNSATSDFFFNIGTNANLNGDFTVFGRVVFGVQTLLTLNSSPTYAVLAPEQPIRYPLVKRAVRVAAGEFPLLPMHTGTWFDPANPGKGFLIEIAQVDGSSSGPLVVVSWYDFHQGKQIWMIGTAPFAWGASSVEVPLQISEGAQFGSAFVPGQVVSNPNFGRITLRFTGCDTGSFTYTTQYGNGTFPVKALTLPTDEVCAGN